MARDTAIPHDELRRIFHEPKRLAIVACLCRNPKGMTFTEIRDHCDLTDGNVNSHLKTLETADVVVQEKRFVNRRPQTTVHLTRRGRAEFARYLDALEEALKAAANALAAQPAERPQTDLPPGHPAFNS